MNSNRNNNRRRGRGSNRSGSSNGNGNGGSYNRIDSRARGNAPQMLEKYKKLANDASLNDDRVQTEYYLQFADHYFRVIADMKSPKDDQRSRREFDRDEDEEEEGEEDRRRPLPGSDSRGADDPREEREEREERGDQDEREEREPGEGLRGLEGEEAEEEHHPFLADRRAGKPRKPARRRAPARSDPAEGQDGPQAGDFGFDPDVLPPAIARVAKGGDGRRGDEAGRQEPKPAAQAGLLPAKERKPARPRLPRPPRKDGDEETLEAVG